MADRANRAGVDLRDKPGGGTSHSSKSTSRLDFIAGLKNIGAPRQNNTPTVADPIKLIRNYKGINDAGAEVVRASQSGHPLSAHLASESKRQGINLSAQLPPAAFAAVEGAPKSPMSIESLFKQLQKSKKPKEREFLKGLIGHGTRYLVAEGRKKIVKEYKEAEGENISKLSPDDKSALRDLDKRLSEAVKVGMLDKDTVESIKQNLHDPKKAVKLFETAIKAKIDLLERIKQAAIRKFIELAVVYTKFISGSAKKAPEVKPDSAKTVPVVSVTKQLESGALQDLKPNPEEQVLNSREEEKRVLDRKKDGNYNVQEGLVKKDEATKAKSTEEKKQEEKKEEEKKLEFSARLEEAIRGAHLPDQVKALIQNKFNPDLLSMSPMQLADWIRLNIKAG